MQSECGPDEITLRPTGLTSGASLMREGNQVLEELERRRDKILAKQKCLPSAVYIPVITGASHTLVTLATAP